MAVDSRASEAAAQPIQSYADAVAGKLKASVGASPGHFPTVAKAKTGSRFPPIQLAARQYGLKDGKPSISFTSAELQVGIDYLKHTLVAKFSGGRPPIEEIRKSLLAAWTLTGQCSIGAWDAKHILVVLDSEHDVRSVMSHPLRKIGHSLFRVFRWTKDFSTRREPTITTAWIRLCSLPPEMYNQGYIETIVASFGRFLAVDKRTDCFVNPSFARVCMEIDISKELPDEVWISTGVETGFWQKILYESRMQYCSKCKLHGHSIETCRKVKQKQAEIQEIWAARGHPSVRSIVPAFQETVCTDKSLSRIDGHNSKDSENNDTVWTVAQKKNGKLIFRKESQLQAAASNHQNSNSSARNNFVDPSISEVITCQLPKSRSLDDLDKVESSRHEIALNTGTLPANGPDANGCPLIGKQPAINENPFGSNEVSNEEWRLVLSKKKKKKSKCQKEIPKESATSTAQEAISLFDVDISQHQNNDPSEKHPQKVFF